MSIHDGIRKIKSLTTRGESKEQLPMRLRPRAKNRFAKLQLSTSRMRKQYKEIVSALPTQSPIFLPTERISLDARVAGVKRVREIYDAKLDQIYRPALRALAKKYSGTGRCFVIGNGSSLNATDLSVLKNEVTFSVNGFFLKSRELSWRPTFYVVEDHLVAEDRRDWINAFKGPIKLFPAYLGYCLDQGDDTIFFNHQPRKSFPNGFDFSTNAEEITYAGCTVTFTCLQLAHYLGFRETYLIGVDADYKLPKDVESNESYGVGVLDMASDDPNHFDPDYFGKGFRWHDPQVDKMLNAFKEARRVTEKGSQRIFNAGIGGKLEVFERRPFVSLFPHAICQEELHQNSKRIEVSDFYHGNPKAEAAFARSAPKLLLIDDTSQCDGTATGELKSNLLAGWPIDRILQLFSSGGKRIGVISSGRSGQLRNEKVHPASIPKFIQDFSPDVVLYRPLPDDNPLHTLATNYLREHDTKLVTWIMDDWPNQLSQDDPDAHKRFDADLRFLLDRSEARLSICNAMSQAFESRYGHNFIPVANGVDPCHWPKPRTHPPRTFTVRYVGSLATNMVLESVMRVAEAVENLASEGLDIRFEIKTRDMWKRENASNFEQFSCTHFFARELSPKDYRAYLSESDVVLIAYNFDALSIGYVRYSLANKLPECLASGAALLVHGPRGLATIDTVHDLKVAVMVTEPDVSGLQQSLKDLYDSPFKRYEMALKAQSVAFKQFNVHSNRSVLRQSLVEAAGCMTKSGNSLCFSRSVHAHVDETAVVSKLLANRKGREHVMLDIGAHFGSSAHYFHELDWNIKCFEPDASNRKRLKARFKKAENVSIDSRAVSDKPAHAVTLFSSEESSGISGLHAFRDTHRAISTVDVTTIRDVVSTFDLGHVDFLKIDVEGFDFNVLKGVPWEIIRPDVVEVEFEDSKTLPLGHTYKDIADYLVELGYEIYLSEWHPIVRYGIRHDWRQLIRYPAELKSREAWGNILAFQNDPGPDAIVSAFEACLEVETAQNELPDVASDSVNRVSKYSGTDGVARQMAKVLSDEFLSRMCGKSPTAKISEAKTTGLPTYTRFALWAKNNHTLIYGIGRFVMWLVRIAKSNPAFVLAYAAVISVLVGLPLLPSLMPFAIAFYFAAGLITIVCIAGASAAYAAFLVRTQNDSVLTRLRAEQSDLSRYVDEKLELLKQHCDSKADSLLSQLKTQIASLQQELNTKVDFRQKRFDSLLSDSEIVKSNLLNSKSQLGHSHQQSIEEGSSLSAANAETAGAIDKLVNATGRSAQLANLASVFNYGRYQPFNRTLTDAQIRSLEITWSKYLNIEVTSKSLAYMAHRACILESQMHGRLATSIENMILRTLVALGIKRSHISVLEIGTLFGTGASIMYDAIRFHFQKLNFTLIDPLDGYYDGSSNDILTGEPVNQGVLLRNLQIAGVNQWDVHLIQRMSTDHEAISAAGKHEYDILIIDGDHSFEGVNSDFGNYASTVRPGGYIIFDDYGAAEWPDVTAFVDKKVIGIPSLEFVGSEFRSAVFRVINPSD